MSKIKIHLYIAAIIATILFMSCKHNPQEEVTPVTTNPINNTNNDSVSFQTEILPLLTGNCAMGGCHDQASAADGVVLTNYNNVINTGKVKAFDPNKSKLYEELIKTNSSKRMPPPPAPALTQAQIALIAKWINEGARNTNIIRCDTNTFKFVAIQTIMNNNCIGCHSSANPQGGVNLVDYANIKQQTQSGKLLCSINQVSGCSPMPSGGNKMDACKIIIIQKWAASGCPNN